VLTRLPFSPSCLFNQQNKESVKTKQKPGKIDGKTSLKTL
jgi:hypothetical protein